MLGVSPCACVSQAEIRDITNDIRKTSFSAVRAAEQQGAQLKRLMDMSSRDNSKTHDMLEQVGDGVWVGDGVCGG